MSGQPESIKPLFSWRSALCDSNLPATTRLVALALSLYMSERGDSAYPGATRLARDTALSDRCVRTQLARLVDEGWLTLTESGGLKGHRRRANAYAAVVPTRERRSPVRTPEPRSPVNVTTLTPEPHDITPPNHVHPNSSYELIRELSISCATSLFDEFWKSYPKRQGKGAAKAAWEKAVKRVDPSLVVAAAARYAAERQGEDPQFTPLPATWLNQERWTDEPDPQPVPKKLRGLAKWAGSSVETVCR